MAKVQRVVMLVSFLMLVTVAKGLPVDSGAVVKEVDGVATPDTVPAAAVKSTEVEVPSAEVPPPQPLPSVVVPTKSSSSEDKGVTTVTEHRNSDGSTVIVTRYNGPPGASINSVYSGIYDQALRQLELSNYYSRLLQYQTMNQIYASNLQNYFNYNPNYNNPAAFYGSSNNPHYSTPKNYYQNSIQAPAYYNNQNSYFDHNRGVGVTDGIGSGQWNGFNGGYPVNPYAYNPYFPWNPPATPAARHTRNSAPDEYNQQGYGYSNPEDQF